MKGFLKNINAGSTALACLLAVVTTVLGAISQNRDIEEAIDKRLNQKDTDEDDEDEEES